MGNAYIDQGPDDEILTFQEILKDDPFWILVACILVNQTNWKQAKPVLEEIMGAYGDHGLANEDPAFLATILRPLGLHNRRSVSLVNMARDYITEPPKTAEDVLKLRGCGKYAADSWAIFVEGRTDVEPTDNVLIHYLKRNKHEQG